MLVMFARKKDDVVLTKSLACCFSVNLSSFSNTSSCVNLGVKGTLPKSLGAAPGVFIALFSGLLSGDLG